jgi:iron complex outermembrane receptor protein
VINIVTRQPKGRPDVLGQFSVGNYDRLDADVALDFPIIDDLLAGKVSALHHSEKGWVTNVVDGTPMGNQNVSGLRGYLKWTPADNFDATLIQEFDLGRNGSPIVVQGAGPGELEYVPAGTQLPGDLLPQYPSPCLPAGQPCHAPDHYYSANSSVPDRDDFNIYATTLTMNARTPFGELVSITGFKRFWEDNYTDQDGTVLYIDDTRRITHGYQLSEELRDTIRPMDSLRVLFGGFFSYDEYHHEQNFRQQGFLAGLRNLTFQNQVRNSESLFAQAYWNVTPKLVLQGGVRGTSEGARMIASVANFISPTGQSVFYGDNPLPGAFAARGEKTWKDWGAKVGLNYQWTDRLMTYAYVARGFKSGGFVGRIVLPQDIGPYNPEHVDTVEGGIKADWLQNSLRTNLALFYNKYKNLQVAEIYFVKDVNGNPTGQQGNSILNAANAETKGVELEVTFAPTAKLTLNASAAYLKATYTDFLYNQPDGTSLDMSGRDLQNAPRWTASGGFTYEIPLPAGHISVGATDRYTGAHYFSNILDTPRSLVQATNYIDANLDWHPRMDDTVWFSLWGRNLADRHYLASVFDVPGVIGLVNYAAPREFGFTVNLEWK